MRVSAPHLLSVCHAGYLCYGVLKQVQDDYFFTTCHEQAQNIHLQPYRAISHGVE